ncbi:MAG: glycosyltransferase family 9 protein [Microscillaceae bacterium]|nr:glycosyltransferase family 9 protein [Microscillaceae bacterium]
MLQNIHKILIIQTAFIGDVILGTVVIEKLRKYYPESRIDFLLRKGNESLLEGNPNLHQVLIWDKKKQKNRNLLRLIIQIRKQRYDLVVNLQRFTSMGILTVLSGARFTVGFDKNPLSLFFSQKIPHRFDEGQHEVERNLSLIAAFTDNIRIRPHIYPSEEDFERVRLHKKQAYICIAPTSVWYTKQFAAEKWIEFLDLLDVNLKVYLLGSSQDWDACEYIRQSTKHPLVVTLAAKLSLLESAALMQDALMNYVNDSAPMHLSSAVNAPTCVVYCSTIPAFGFGPLSDNAHVVEITEKLSCRPCGLHGLANCPEGHFRCAKDIDVRRLLLVSAQS